MAMKGRKYRGRAGDGQCRCWRDFELEVDREIDSRCYISVMNSNLPETSSDPAPPKFRMNAAAAKMLMICGLALLLPITLTVIGFSNLRKESAANADAVGPEAEPAGLRQTLEAIADEKLPPPKIEGGARRFVFEKSAAFEQTAQQIQGIIARSNATAMQTDDSRSRWIVQVPAAEAQKFDESLGSLKPVQLPSYPIQDKSEEVVFYEINLTRVP